MPILDQTSTNGIFIYCSKSRLESYTQINLCKKYDYFSMPQLNFYFENPSEWGIRSLVHHFKILEDEFYQGCRDRVVDIELSVTTISYPQ